MLKNKATEKKGWGEMKKRKGWLSEASMKSYSLLLISVY